MFRKLVAISLLVSFVAMASSGLMMFVINRPSFTIQMHAVHKFFGLVMVGAMSCHLVLNFQSLRAHLASRASTLVASALVALLVGLYGLTLTKAVPADLATELDALAKQAD